MPVTLKDIAARVGKSVPTVSRALGGFEDISPKTRAEVQRIARDMGYVPSVTERKLQQQKTETIALILPTVQNLRFSDSFFSTTTAFTVVEKNMDRVIAPGGDGDDSDGLDDVWLVAKLTRQGATRASEPVEVARFRAVA